MTKVKKLPGQDFKPIFRITQLLRQYLISMLLQRLFQVWPAVPTCLEERLRWNQD